ncbi:MAG: cobalamin B12-binding domain-containing protein [Phycisphaerales bacterium]
MTAEPRSSANGAGPFAATVLRSGARALAAHAAERLLERDGEAEHLFGTKSFRGWQDNLCQRIEELAAATEVGSPAMFRRDVGWSVSAFLARGVPVGPVERSLRALREAIAADLPEHAAAAVLESLDAGIDEAGRPQPAIVRLSPDRPLGELALHYLQTVLEGDRRAAIALLTEQLAAGRSLAELYERVLLPVESEVGTMWHLGEISVPEEHAATEATRCAMAVLAHLAPADSARPGTVILGAVEGDRHDIGVRAVADLVELAGFRAISMGADVPIRDIVRACEDFGASLLVLSATMTVHLPGVQRAITAVRSAPACQSVRFVVGGEAFSADPELAGRVGADAYARSPSDAVKVVTALLG